MIDKLNEVVHLCGINDIVFQITKEGEENSVEFNDKLFVINIPNDKDVEFERLLNKKIEDLKKTLK
jgi:hypothetical protein